MIKIKLSNGSTELKRGTELSTGLDLKIRGFSRVMDNKIQEPVWFDDKIKSVEIMPQERLLAKTGVSFEMEEPMIDEFGNKVIIDTQVRNRSGLSIKDGLFAMLGTADVDYRGDVGVMLINLSNKPITINVDDRVGQLVFGYAVIPAKIEYVSDINETERVGGFGSTGKQ